MSDYIQDSGYFGYYPFENMRERRKGILISEFQSPVNLTTLASNKIDFVYLRLGSGYDVVALDANFDSGDTVTIKTDVLLTYLAKGFSIGYYLNLTPYSDPTPWDTSNAYGMGILFADYLKELRRIGVSNPYEMTPMIEIRNGSMPLVSATTVKAYLDQFKVGWDYAVSLYGETYDMPYTDFIIRMDYATSQRITGTLDLASDYPLLCLDGAYTNEYASASSSTTYPATAFTLFGGYTKPALHLYYVGSGLNSKYGIGASATALFTVPDDYIEEVYLKAPSLVTSLNLYVLDENQSLLTILTNNQSNKGSTFECTKTVTIDGIDSISGTIIDGGEDTGFVAVGNYIMFIDATLNPVIYEIVETSSDTDTKTFYANHISTQLETDILTSASVGMESLTIGEHIENALTDSTNSFWELGDVIGIFDSTEDIITLNNLENDNTSLLESGYLNATTGAEEVNASYVRSVESCSTTNTSVEYMYRNDTVTDQAYLYYWDDSDTYIGRLDLGATGQKFFTMPYNAKSFRIVVNSTNVNQEIILTLSNFKYYTLKEFMDSVAKTFNCYYKYRIVIEENDVLDEFLMAKCYIDVYNKIGNTNNAILYIDNNNVSNLEVSERVEELYTAVIPRSENVSYIDWYAYARTDGNYVKTANSYLLEDTNLKDKYGKAGTTTRRDRVATTELNDATNSLSLFNLAKKYLSNYNSPKYQYDMTTTKQITNVLDFPRVGDDNKIIISSYKQKQWADTTHIRYIRNKVNGSNVNTSAVFNEIQAYNKQGENIALLYGTVTAEEFSGGTWNNVATPALTQPSGGTDFSSIVDNNLTSWLIPTFNATPQRITVDLGNNYNIETIQITHFYADNREFNENVTEVSTDGINWYTLYDSDVNGTYPETGDSTYTKVFDAEPISPSDYYPYVVSMPYTYNAVFRISTNSGYYTNYISADVPIYIKVDYDKTPDRFSVGTIDTGNWSHIIADYRNGSTILNNTGTAPLTYQTGELMLVDFDITDLTDTVIQSNMFNDPKTVVYNNTLQLTVPYDIDPNEQDFVYENYIDNLSIVEIEYKLHYLKEAIVKIGKIQKDITEVL